MNNFKRALLIGFSAVVIVPILFGLYMGVLWVVGEVITTLAMFFSLRFALGVVAFVMLWALVVWILEDIFPK